MQTRSKKIIPVNNNTFNPSNFFNPTDNNYNYNTFSPVNNIYTGIGLNSGLRYLDDPTYTNSGSSYFDGSNTIYINQYDSGGADNYAFVNSLQVGDLIIYHEINSTGYFVFSITTAPVWSGVYFTIVVTAQGGTGTVAGQNVGIDFVRKGTSGTNGTDGINSGFKYTDVPGSNGGSSGQSEWNGSTTLYLNQYGSGGEDYYSYLITLIPGDVILYHGRTATDYVVLQVTNNVYSTGLFTIGVTSLGGSGSPVNMDVGIDFEMINGSNGTDGLNSGLRYTDVGSSFGSGSGQSNWDGSSTLYMNQYGSTGEDNYTFLNTVKIGDTIIYHSRVGVGYIVLTVTAASWNGTYFTFSVTNTGGAGTVTDIDVGVDFILQGVPGSTGSNGINSGLRYTDVSGSFGNASGQSELDITNSLLYFNQYDAFGADNYTYLSTILSGDEVIYHGRNTTDYIVLAVSGAAWNGTYFTFNITSAGGTGTVTNMDVGVDFERKAGDVGATGSQGDNSGLQYQDVPSSNGAGSGQSEWDGSASLYFNRYGASGEDNYNYLNGIIVGDVILYHGRTTTDYVNLTVLSTFWNGTNFTFSVANNGGTGSPSNISVSVDFERVAVAGSTGINSGLRYIDNAGSYSSPGYSYWDGSTTLYINQYDYISGDNYAYLNTLGVGDNVIYHGRTSTDYAVLQITSATWTGVYFQFAVTTLGSTGSTSGIDVGIDFERQTGLADAPSDGVHYDRLNAAWVNARAYPTADKAIADSGYTVVINSDYMQRWDMSGGACTTNLPVVATATGMSFIFKKIDSTADTLTITGYVSDLIDGSNTYVITTQWQSVTLFSNGVTWDII